MIHSFEPETLEPLEDKSWTQEDEVDFALDILATGSEHGGRCRKASRDFNRKYLDFMNSPDQSICYVPAPRWIGKSWFAAQRTLEDHTQGRSTLLGSSNFHTWDELKTKVRSLKQYPYSFRSHVATRKIYRSLNSMRGLGADAIIWEDVTHRDNELKNEVVPRLLMSAPKVFVLYTPKT